MKRKFLRLSIAGAIAMVMMLGISVQFTSEGSLVLKADKEAMAFDDLVYKDYWEQCTAVVLVQSGASFIPVNVPGAKNECEWEWWSSCNNQTCAPTISGV